MSFEIGSRYADGPPTVSVVIVNYNGKHFMEECLNSLFAKGFSKYSFEVIVVDNNSQDGSQELLRKFKKITFIESTVNTGFTGGNNLGAHSANGKYLLLLNNDTRIETSLDPLVDAIQDSEIGAVGCQLRYANGNLQFSMGFEHTPLRIILSWLGVEKKKIFPNIFRRLDTHTVNYANKYRSVDWVSGAVLLTSRDHWNALNGLDDSYFMYCEDVDYCKRLREIGKQIIYLSGSTVTHHEGAGRIWIGRRALLNTARSYFIYITKHYGATRGRATCFGLSAIFLMRSIVFKTAAVFGRRSASRELSADKSTGYKLAAISLLKAAMTGHPPSRS